MNKFQVKSIFIIAILFVTSWQVSAQSTKDLFSLEGLALVTSIPSNSGPVTFSTSFYIGETIIEGVEYLEYHDSDCVSSYFRVDGFKVYRKDYLPGEDETLVYDFGLDEGDVLEVAFKPMNEEIMILDFEVALVTSVILLDDVERIGILLLSSDWFEELFWVEGIGLFDFNNQGCIKDDDGFIFVGNTEEECFARSCKNMVADFDIQIDDNVVSLTNKSENYEEFVWSMGDGNYYVDENVNHAYAEDGCREIILTVGNSCGVELQKSYPFGFCSDSLWVLKNETAFNEVSMIDENDGWAITEDSMFETNDGGENWEEFDFDFQNTSTSYDFLDLKMSGNFGVILLRSSASDSDILKTSDFGASWEEVQVPGIIFNTYNQISVDYFGNIMISSSNTVTGSKDFGNTWYVTELFGFFTVARSKMDQGENGTVVVTSESVDDVGLTFIHMSSDYGFSFSESLIENNFNVKSVSLVNETCYLVTDKGVWKTKNLGGSWNKVFKLFELKDFKDINFVDEDRGVLTTSKSIYRTEDGGENWDIEYCQNNFGLIGVEIFEDKQFLFHSNGLSKYEPEQNYECTTSINSVLKEFDVKIFPNPTSGRIYIKSKSVEIETISVSTMTGKLIYFSQPNSIETNLNLDQFEEGIYIVRLESENGVVVSERIVRM